MNEKIDFVITYVDGNDENWLSKRKKYITGTDKLNESETRYRNWENLQYWFRGVEKFASFVNRIHFITDGQVPEWLNVEHPKLNIVKHSDYIPEKYLPTFSAIPIEINIHKIKGLEEHFVFFNDDMFLTDYVKEEDFFINGKPVDRYVESAIIKSNESYMFPHIFLNCISVINKNFDKKACIENFKEKWLSKKNGKEGT